MKLLLMHTLSPALAVVGAYRVSWYPSEVLLVASGQPPEADPSVPVNIEEDPLWMTELVEFAVTELAGRKLFNSTANPTDTTTTTRTPTAILPRYSDKAFDPRDGEPAGDYSSRFLKFKFNRIISTTPAD